jgi:hypothetical protein
MINNLLTAAEALEISSQAHKDPAIQPELKRLCEQIKFSANNGDRKIHVYGILKTKVVNALIELGYTVVKDMDGESIISW